MNTVQNGQDFDVWKNIKIEEDEVEGGQIITFVKKGHGIRKTKRPLGAVRLELALDEAKMSQSELARRLNVGQPAINRIITGKTRNSNLLPLIAKELGKNQLWLAGNEPNDKSIAMIQDDFLVIDNEPFIIVKHYSNGNSDNSDTENLSIDAKGIVILAKDQLPEIANVEGLRFIYQPDRAMAPEIKSGASVTFDTHDTEIINGDMYAIQVGNIECSRCLFVQPDGSILIRAKQADFPDYTINNTDSNFKVLGKVVFVSNKI
ncbi:hypothetical protein F965_00035 [Acinetobacter schindleri NIPH 900]|uniref:HTH cro/C1-type domain-containing protein n=1 Tax=Acinetobacter schindleri NIPH 900 TaxID=1217675 RepID=N8Y043_9GAMM|nr:S24 family peptidase [Acinetobacter schindleri]ENV14689.1 hypothetical protein F965_00035 [Acinetobacter schindleri NIPH 900]